MTVLILMCRHMSFSIQGHSCTCCGSTMNVTGTDVSDPSFPGEDTPGTTVTLDARSSSVGESGPSVYAATLSSGCSSSIATGQTKTCTITNNDVAPQLTVKKIVNNDDG